MAPFLPQLIRLAVVLTPILFKSFREAYKQAAKNGPKLDFSKKVGIKTNQKPPMTFEEAAKILGFEQEVKTKDQVDFTRVQTTFEKLFTVNDPKKGGSPYIQSRVWNARQQIEADMLKDGLLKEEQYQEFKKATDDLLLNLRNLEQPQQQQQQAQAP